MTIDSLSAHIPTITIVGGMNIDAKFTFNRVTQLADTKDVADNAGAFLGGGAANCAIEIDKLTPLFNQKCTINLITRRGRLPNEDDFDDFNEYVLASMAHHGTNLLLDHSKLNIIDITRGMVNQIGINGVDQYNSGRHISKQDIPSTEGFVDGINEIIEANVEHSDYIFIDPSKPKTGLIAARSAMRNNVPMMIDHGAKMWPTDPKEDAQLDELLSLSSIIVVPSDAVVKGMEDHIKNPGELFSHIKNRYNAKTIIMSDGISSVKIMHDGVEDSIPVSPAKGSIYACGVGDTRNAALLNSLVSGHTMFEAAKRATAIASVKVQYPDDSWATHEELRKHLGEHPSFMNDFKL